MIIFDKRRFQQVLLNLLTNAVKNQTKGVITIFSALRNLEDSKTYLEVTVRDQGIGMSEDTLK